MDSITSCFILRQLLKTCKCAMLCMGHATNGHRSCMAGTYSTAAVLPPDLPWQHQPHRWPKHHPQGPEQQRLCHLLARGGHMPQLAKEQEAH
jgi:hypothetical protein